MASDTLAGLDALDLADQTAPGGTGRLAGRTWSALWPKLAAVALVLVIWELIHLSGWKKYVFPGPGGCSARPPGRPAGPPRARCA